MLSLPLCRPRPLKKSLQRILTACTRLHTLVLDFCPSLDDAGLLSAMHACGRLALTRLSLVSRPRAPLPLPALLSPCTQLCRVTPGTSCSSNLCRKLCWPCVPFAWVILSKYFRNCA